jgi:replicative DNA helicase
MAARFKGLAHSTGASLTIVSQVVRPGRDNPKREPTMHDLKESGDLENASEAIVILHKRMNDQGEFTGQVRARICKGKTEIGDATATFITNQQGQLVEMAGGR